MTITTLIRRLSKLAGAGMTTESYNARINRTLAEGRERSRAWYRAGNTGPMPLRPIPELQPNATRLERSSHDAATVMRARAERSDARMAEESRP